jgi:hypothetical protein
MCAFRPLYTSALSLTSSLSFYSLLTLAPLSVRVCPWFSLPSAPLDHTHVDLPYQYSAHFGWVKDMQVSRRALASRKSSADVVCFSGCKDSDKSTSMEMVEGGMVVGALTFVRPPRLCDAGALTHCRHSYKVSRIGPSSRTLTCSGPSGTCACVPERTWH